jgi:hypothetical protein
MDRAVDRTTPAPLGRSFVVHSWRCLTTHIGAGVAALWPSVISPIWRGRSAPGRVGGRRMTLVALIRAAALVDTAVGIISLSSGIGVRRCGAVSCASGVIVDGRLGRSTACRGGRRSPWHVVAPGAGPGHRRRGVRCRVRPAAFAEHAPSLCRSLFGCLFHRLGGYRRRRHTQSRYRCL